MDEEESVLEFDKLKHVGMYETIPRIMVLFIGFYLLYGKPQSQIIIIFWEASCTDSPDLFHFKTKQ